MFEPGKTTYAKVTYADIAGLEGSADKSGLSGSLLNQLSQMEGLLHVVRCFDNPSVPHTTGSVDPLRDVSTMDYELLLNDLIAVERKLERLGDELKKSGGRDKAVVHRENALFQKLHASLSSEQPLRDLPISPDETKILSSHAFQTLKPILVVLNLSDGQIPPLLQYPHAHSEVIGLQGKLEMELAQLSPEDAEIFMLEYGIQELGFRRVISLSYQLLGLQSFFTVGKDEVRAWTVRKAASALEAAGAIHSDLQKGFIRAEVVSYQDLLALGGLAEARARGKLRLEGKEYIVQDGDILHVRFNI
jgi:GTP-binding protein YchF